MRCTAYFQYEPTALYRIVFTTRWVRCAALLLFIFFTIQPASQAFAAEDTQTGQETTPSVETQEAIQQPLESDPQESDAASPLDEDEAQELLSDEEDSTLYDTGTIEDATELQTDTQTDTDTNTEPVAQNTDTVTDEVDERLPTLPPQDAVATFSETESANMQDDTQGHEMSDTSGTTGTVDIQTFTASINATSTGTSTVELDASTGTASSSALVMEQDVTEIATSTESSFEVAQKENLSTSASSTNRQAQVSPKSANDDSDMTIQNKDASDEDVRPEENRATTSVLLTDDMEATQVFDDNADDTSTATATDRIASSSKERETQVVYITAPVVNDQNRNQFSVDECVFVGDGSYYCSKKTGEETGVNNKTVLYAPDRDGDQEIFFNSGDGELRQITFNTVDDTAPEYDALSNSIVWQRLINDRYQIVTYDLQKGEEQVLTNTDVNNMEPSREGDSIVWQRWYDNNWEIVLYSNGREEILTDNNVPDIAPDIENGYIIWRQGVANSTQVLVYEIESRTTSVIDDNEGGQVVNPRFVLVYDTKYDNGDIVTKGFDPATGSVVPLSAQPAEKPVDLPDTDPTGETRALIGNKSSGREEFTLELKGSQPQDAMGDGVGNAEWKHASDTSEISAELQESDITVTTVDMTQATGTSDTLPLTDFDLIVEPYATITPSQETGGSASSTTETN